MQGTYLKVSQLSRESNIELLRLISQYYIVFYHILLLFVYPTTGIILYKALWLPLHVGVVIFVLISGFFTIKPSSKGLWKLLAVFFIYSLPEVTYNISHANNHKEIVKSLFILSNTHFWFIKTYIFLYLLSPLTNYYFEKATMRQKCYMLFALAFVAQYMALTNGDINMKDGKNVINFIFIYFVGHMLSQYKDKWKEIPFYPIVISYIILNCLIIYIYIKFYNSTLGYYIWDFFFPYSSPGLLLNSILVFILIGKMSLKSKLINYTAASSLAIYLIHANRPYLVGLLGKCSIFVANQTIDRTFLMITILGLLSLVTIIVCIFIDKMLTPLWNKINIIGINIYNKLGY